MNIYRYFAAMAMVIIISAIPCGAIAENITFDIKVTNPLKKDRKDQPVVVDLKAIAMGFDVTRAVIVDNGLEIPCQIDDLDGDGIADEVACVVDIKSKERKNLRLVLSDDESQTLYPARTWAGFQLHGRKKGETVDVTEITVPGNVNFYNMVYGHGPMFESELTGYRVYFNQKQTLDPYGKFQMRIELPETRFYPTDAHRADGYGDDVLMAGNSCGVGAFKGWDGSKAIHIEPVDFRTERVVASGPVRAIVEVEVKGWLYGTRKYNMVNRYTIYAGHRDVQVDVEFDRPLADEFFCTGVERVMGNETRKWSDYEGTVASWGRYYPVTDTVKYEKETIGIATCVPHDNVYGECEDDDNFLYLVSAPGEKSLRYHTMFTSRKEDFGYHTPEAWFAALPAWRKELENPLTIEVKRLSR